MSKVEKKVQKATFTKINGSIENFLENLTFVVEGIASTFGRNCEVVLHDLRHPEKSIVAISNAHVTKRKVGGPIIGGPIDDKGLRKLFDRADHESVVSNYISSTNDGRPMKSTTMIFRNKAGKPVIALCINFELTEILSTKKLLENIAAGNQMEHKMETQATKAQNGNPDIATIMEETIEVALRGIEQPFKFAGKAEKLQALKIMTDRGLFLLKGAVDFAAQRLEVSRYTIYNYLKEIRYL